MMDLVGEFGLISRSLMEFSPFAATFDALVTDGSAAPALIILTVIGLGPAAFGLLGLRRRDLGT